jgi:hypothetical protein
MKKILIGSLALAAVLGTVRVLVADDTKEERKDDKAWTEEFGEADSDLVSTGRNPYWPLEPGYEMVLEGKEKGQAVKLVITVLDETKKFGSVETRIVEERETHDGKINEVSRNYFAISKRTNNVYYFGEDVDIYDDAGKVVNHEGSWLHGQEGAHYGLFVPGQALVGSRFYTELAPKAKDRCEIESVTTKLATKAGTFEGCVKIHETTPLEPEESEHKIFKAGVGLVKDDKLELVKFGQKGH